MASLAQRALLVLMQLGAFVASVLAAFLLRFDFTLPVQFAHYLLFALAVWPLAKFIVFGLSGFLHGWWRQVSLTDILRLIRANAVASTVTTVITLFFAPGGFPRSIYVLDLLVCVALTSSLRITRRVYWELRLRGRAPRRCSPTLIYGAGDAGAALLRELRQNPTLPYEAVGFLDDDPRKRHSTAHGLRILGPGSELASIARRHSVETVLIAVPSAPGPDMVRILGHCRDAGVAFKTVPTLGEILGEAHLSRKVRDVAVEDLLSRAPARLDTELIRTRLAGRRLLVTGAAGSIGSELCRQLANYGPACIVGFDCNESGLFELDRELRQRFPGVQFNPAIGSITNAQRVRDVLEQHQPSMLFHAAAYKHVPLMEGHAFECIENNILGTETVAVEARRANVGDFVMISSDKAVRPTNIMGASKRVAELVVSSLNGGTSKFVCVRFGNVLASNGSVVPIFKKQILAGGPVTVTHPEIRRFFMTIPEAAQLVLQAATMGRGGEIFVLDMGESVRIAELAHNLILLSGLRPGEDIHIEFTGLRPGEKMYEELSFFDENTVPTPHEKIRVVAGAVWDEAEMNSWLARLRGICAARDLGAAVFAIKDLVPDYNPSGALLRQMMLPARAAAKA